MESIVVHEYGIIANYTGDSDIVKGSKCYIVFSNPGNNGDRVKVCFIKRDRYFSKYVNTKKLYNFRSAWFPENIRKFGDRLDCCVYTKQEAIDLVKGFQIKILMNIIKEAIREYFQSLLQQDPELKDKVYFFKGEQAVTYQQMLTVYDDQPMFAEEIEKGIIKLVLDLIARGKKDL